MRLLLCKRNLCGFILAALVAGAWMVPASAAQASAQNSTSTAHASTSAKNLPAGNPAIKKQAKSAGKGSSRKRTKKVKGQKAPTPERISEIQDALVRKGVFNGTPTGKWDDSTVGAMKRFQASSGLSPTGKLDALTLQKLGLGSETAGLAAPNPPPNSTNRLRNLSSTSAEAQAEPRE